VLRAARQWTRPAQPAPWVGSSFAAENCPPPPRKANPAAANKCCDPAPLTQLGDGEELGGRHAGKAGVGRRAGLERVDHVVEVPAARGLEGLLAVSADVQVDQGPALARLRVRACFGQKLLSVRGRPVSSNCIARSFGKDGPKTASTDGCPQTTAAGVTSSGLPCGSGWGAHTSLEHTMPRALGSQVS
jgi:hypothetical protein